MSSQPRKWKFRVRHIQEAIEKVLRYTDSLTAEAFRAHEQTLDAVIWNLVIIGEAVQHIPETVVQAYPELPWPQMRGIRNRIVHAYDQIDYEIIWHVAQNELRPLLPVLQRIMREVAE